MTAPAVTRISMAAQEEGAEHEEKGGHPRKWSTTGEGKRAGHRVAVEDDRKPSHDHDRPRNNQKKRAVHRNFHPEAVKGRRCKIPQKSRLLSRPSPLRLDVAFAR